MIMATAWELSMKLGFIDGGPCTRGSSSLLLGEIEAFAKTWDMDRERKYTPDSIYDTSRMTTSYLYDKGAGFSHWGEPLSNGYCNLLEWPKDAIK